MRVERRGFRIVRPPLGERAYQSLPPGKQTEVFTGTGQAGLPMGRPRFETGRAVTSRWGSGPPASAMEGAPPARERALNPRMCGQQAVGDRHVRLPLKGNDSAGDEAVLIRR